MTALGTVLLLASFSAGVAPAELDPRSDLGYLVGASSSLLELDTITVELSRRIADIDAAYAFLDGRSTYNPYNWTDTMPRPVLRDRKKALRGALSTLAAAMRTAWEE